MTPVIYSLPYDPQGDNPRNRVLREYHDLGDQVGLDYRVLTLDHGHFFVQHLEVVDDTGYELHESDFQCVMVNAEATMATGQEVAAVLVIVNPKVSHKVFVNASMVGGQYCNLTSAIAQAALGLLNPTRFPTWRNVTNKPDKFDVGGHLHAMWELYGFEGMCNALDRIVQLKLASAKAAYDVLLEQHQKRLADLRVSSGSITQQLQEHINQPNPHGTTPTHVNLPLLLNYRPPTQSEAMTLGYNSVQRYLVVGRYREMIETNFTPDLTQHRNDTENPHRLTAVQIGTLAKATIDSRLATKLDIGSTAASTFRFEGLTYPEFYTAMRTDLNASMVTAGTFNIGRLIHTPGKSTIGVVGNNSTANVEQTIRAYLPPNTRMVYLSGADGQDIPSVLASTFSNDTLYPVGTMALTMISYYRTRDYGNGTDTYTWSRLRVYIKTGSSSWSIL